MSEADSTDDPPPTAKWRYEPKDREYARTNKARAAGPGPRRYVMPMARADRRIANPAPEVQPQNITARYHNAGAAGEPGHPAFLLHLNEAGKRIEALLVDLSHGSGAPKYHRFGGNLQGDGTFRLTDNDGNTVAPSRSTTAICCWTTTRYP